MTTTTYEQDDRGRWMIRHNGNLVHTVGRRVGRFGSEAEARSYAARRFGPDEARS